MQKPGQKNIIQICSFILALSVFLLFFPFVLVAQSAEDSVTIFQEDVKEPPDEYEDYQDTAYVTADEKEYFKEKNDADSFVVKERQLPPGYSKKLKEDKDFWYADEDIKKKEKKNKEQLRGAYISFGQRPWVQTLLWLVIIGGFAAAIMWYLIDSNVGLFRKKAVPASSQTEDEIISEDIFAINYQKEIDKAAFQGNYRLAVRLMFLRLLKNLSDKNIIQYKQDRTNLDYLMQVHSTKHYPSFFRLTRHFEYSWYGHFDVEEAAYKVIAKEFDQFDREI